jgi:hypothetical protein
MGRRIRDFGRRTARTTELDFKKAKKRGTRARGFAQEAGGCSELNGSWSVRAIEHFYLPTRGRRRVDMMRTKWGLLDPLPPPSSVSPRHCRTGAGCLEHLRIYSPPTIQNHPHCIRLPPHPKTEMTAEGNPPETQTKTEKQ